MNTNTMLVADSSALLTDDQATACGALIVPATVTVDGIDYLDGVDIESDRFFAMIGSEPQPVISTAQPSPARFLAAYQEAERLGATSVLAVVVGSAYSGTFDSARLAAANAGIGVECIDTGQASFGVGLCVMAAAEALRSGASIEEARHRVATISASIESVFIIQALELARASGRFGPGTLAGDGTGLAIPVLALADGELTVLAEVASLDEAVEAMATRVLESGRRLRVASGLADLATRPVADALENRLRASTEVVELIRYRVGPSVAANTGPGTAGVFWHPLEL